jgi:hypothetical protein
LVFKKQVFGMKSTNLVIMTNIWYLLAKIWYLLAKFWYPIIRLVWLGFFAKFGFLFGFFRLLKAKTGTLYYCRDWISDSGFT